MPAANNMSSVRVASPVYPAIRSSLICTNAPSTADATRGSAGLTLFCLAICCVRVCRSLVLSNSKKTSFMVNRTSIIAKPAAMTLKIVAWLWHAPSPCPARVLIHKQRASKHKRHDAEPGFGHPKTAEEGEIVEHEQVQQFKMMSQRKEDHQNCRNSEGSYLSFFDGKACKKGQKKDKTPNIMWSPGWRLGSP